MEVRILGEGLSNMDFCIENGFVWAIAWAKCVADFHAFEHGVAVFFPVVCATNMLLIETIIAVQYLLLKTVYSSTPIHSKGASPRVDILKSILTIHLPVNAIVMCTVSALTRGQPGMLILLHPSEEVRMWSVGRWVFNFAVYRLVYDASFYVFHRAMHHSSVYAYTHKTHHKHHSTDLSTNYQFSAVDLFVEAMLTVFVAQMFLALLLEPEMPYLAGTVYGTYVQWYQIGSHAPRQMHAATAFPPLSPVYNHPLAKRVRPPSLRKHDAVEFHAAHHKRVKGNYGITPWMDWLLGTMVV